MDRVDFLTPKESRSDTPVRYVTNVHTSTFIDFHARSREGKTLIEAFRYSLAFRATESISLFLRRACVQTVGHGKKKRFSRI